MAYFLKTHPTIVETIVLPENHYHIQKKELVIEDENGIESTIRIIESRDSINFEMLLNDSWVLISDNELLNWLFENC